MKIIAREAKRKQTISLIMDWFHPKEFMKNNSLTEHPI